MNKAKIQVKLFLQTILEQSTITKDTPIYHRIALNNNETAIVKLITTNQA